MELLLALLMALGALAYPLFVDMRKHGRDNILERTAIEIAEWPPIASFLHSFRTLGQRVQQAICRAASLVEHLMDKWTWIGFLITAVLALVGFLVLRSALRFILENWLILLVVLVGAPAFLAYVYQKKNSKMVG